MWSWHVGKILGIDLKIHMTFPLILLWAAWEFGNGRSVSHAIFGATLVLLLFVCVLLHELGHALTAQRYGIAVEDITLLPIGGLAKFRAMQDHPVQEFVIALAGPLVNVVIAILLLPMIFLFTNALDPALVTHVTQRGGVSELGAILILLARAMRNISVEGALAYLFFANVMLTLFNLIPAFPMDGGRIFRALLAMRLNYKLATTIAVRVGQLLALLAVLLVFRGAQLGPGLLIIALFIFITGNAELHRVALREILARGQVGTYMMQGLHPLYPEWSLYSARLLAQQTGQRAFPVIDDGQLRGLLTVREMHNNPPSMTVGQAMVEEYPVLAPARTLYDAQLVLQSDDQFAAAVMEDNHLLGVLSLEDIERAYHSLRRQPRLSTA
jgi:Zn-dependent protease